MGFRVYGLELVIWGLGSRVLSLTRVYGLELMIWGLGPRVLSLTSQDFSRPKGDKSASVTAPPVLMT